MDIKTQMFNFCFGIKNKLTLQVHLFMHCHIKSYDRTGEGLAMDHDFIDKFGVPNKLEHFWMEGFVFFTFTSSSKNQGIFGHFFDKPTQVKFECHKACNVKYNICYF